MYETALFASYVTMSHLARPPQPAPEELDEVPLDVAAGALAAEDAVLTDLQFARRSACSRAGRLAMPTLSVSE